MLPLGRVHTVSPPVAEGKIPALALQNAYLMVSFGEIDGRENARIFQSSQTVMDVWKREGLLNSVTIQLPEVIAITPPAIFLAYEDDWGAVSTGGFLDATARQELVRFVFHCFLDFRRQRFVVWSVNWAICF